MNGFKYFATKMSLCWYFNSYIVASKATSFGFFINLKHSK